MATQSSILALKIQWAEVNYSSQGSKESNMAEHKPARMRVHARARAHTHAHLEIRGLSSC